MGGDIDGWLEQFREAWISHDIDAVIDLFTDDVDYYETPFEQLEGKEEIREEWEAVLHQEDISLDFDIYAEEKDRNVVKWSLSYTTDGERHSFRGIYLIELDEGNRCSAFWQYSERL